MIAIGYCPGAIGYEGVDGPVGYKGIDGPVPAGNKEVNDVDPIPAGNKEVNDGKLSMIPKEIKNLFEVMFDEL